MPGPLSRTRAVLQSGIDQRLHLGAQLYVCHAGLVVADISLGESRPGVEMTADSVNLWMSSTKPVAAVAIAQLWERGLLDLDDRVARHIPEFGVRGKESITIRHILTHTGGFRAVPGLDWNDPYEQVLSKTCEAPLEPRWVPGRTAGYHPHAAWYILAELVHRLDGRSFDAYVRESIFGPLGMNDSWIGMPPEAFRAYGLRIGFVYDTRIPEQPRQPSRGSGGNTQEDAAALRPSSNGRGPMRELGHFYEMLLRKGLCGVSGSRLLLAQTVEATTARHRAGLFDQTFKHVMDWGLGFLINSNQYGVDTVPYGYGPYAGPRAFGHSGQQSSCAFCDPENQLVAAWMCNGMPGEPRHALRQREINQAIYEDLRLSATGMS